MGTQNEILNELNTDGIKIPSEKLIKYFDAAVKEGLIVKSDAANAVGVQNARTLDEIFNEFTAKQHQFESALSPQVNQKPELHDNMKTVLVEQLKKAYTL